MRFAVVSFLAIVSIAGCGSIDLQPIVDPRSDAATSPQDDAAPGDGRAALGDAGVACKRGIATNAAPSAAFAPTASSPGVSWWYNYAAQPPGGGAPIEFVPMIWGGGSLTETIPAGSRYLLGFNEPNSNTQSNLTAQQAAADWPAVQAKAAALGIPIVSPGVNFCGSAADPSKCTEPAVTDPYAYLEEFFAACKACKVDYIAVHWYNCDVPSLRAYLHGDADAGLQGFVQFERPIWVTEFSCDKSHTAAQQKAYMQAAVAYLESEPLVVRYAWFSADPIPSAELANSDGSPTDLGTTYAGLPESCR